VCLPSGILPHGDDVAIFFVDEATAFAVAATLRSVGDFATLSEADDATLFAFEAARLTVGDLLIVSFVFDAIILAEFTTFDDDFIATTLVVYATV
jgi:hypothetical protein